MGMMLKNLVHLYNIQSTIVLCDKKVKVLSAVLYTLDARHTHTHTHCVGEERGGGVTKYRIATSYRQIKDSAEVC